MVALSKKLVTMLDHSAVGVITGWKQRASSSNMFPDHMNSMTYLPECSGACHTDRQTTYTHVHTYINKKMKKNFLLPVMIINL